MSKYAMIHNTRRGFHIYLLNIVMVFSKNYIKFLEISFCDL